MNLKPRIFIPESPRNLGDFWEKCACFQGTQKTRISFFSKVYPQILFGRGGKSGEIMLSLLNVVEARNIKHNLRSEREFSDEFSFSCMPGS